MASPERPRRQPGQLAALSTVPQPSPDCWIGLGVSIALHLALIVGWRVHSPPLEQRFEPRRQWQSLKVTFVQRAPRPRDLYIPVQRKPPPRTHEPIRQRTQPRHRIPREFEAVKQERRVFRETLNLEGLVGQLIVQAGGSDVLLGDDLFDPTILGDWLRRRRSQRTGEVVLCSLRIHNDGTWAYRERTPHLALRERGTYKLYGDTLYVQTHDSTDPARTDLVGRVRYVVEGKRLELKPLPSESVDFAWLRRD